MFRITSRTLAVLAAYAMLIVLVCPDIPTPIYTCKEKAADQPAVAAPAAALEIIGSRLPAVFVQVHQKPGLRSEPLSSLTCQRLC